MSSVKIEAIYRKLLESYANLSRGGDTIWILNSHIEAYARNQWNSKEPAILDLALRNGVRIPDLEALISEGLPRDDAILKVSKKMKFQVSEAQAKKWLEHYRKERARKEAAEQKIESANRDYERGVEKLTALFSKGEISEESYKIAVRKIEKEQKLRQEKPVSPAFEKPSVPPLSPKISARELSSLPPEQPPEELYERKYSVTRRFYKLLTAPSTAMRDIALAPDYNGVLVVIALEIVFMVITLVIVQQKISISGPYADSIWGMVSAILLVAIIVSGVVVLPVKWLIKSLLVKYACDSGSEWDFKTAASVTGYAYIADLIIGIPGVLIAWFLLPTFHIDTTSLGAAEQALIDYQAQLTWLRLLYSLPVSLVGLLWKSCLGGLGTHFGTKEKCSLRMGIGVFIGLSLIGLLISFVI